MTVAITHRLGFVFERARIERLFWSRVRKTKGCWLWTGGTRGHNDSPRPVLKVHIGNWRKRLHVNFSGSHLSWELHFGPVPEGMDVLHRCDVTMCVRPSHLFTGDQLDNVRDCSAKGRIRTAQHRNALTLRERENAALMYTLGLSGREVAEIFGVDRTYVYKMAKRYAKQESR